MIDRTDVIGTGTVIAPGLNVHRGSPTGAVIEQLKCGDEFNVVQRRDSWMIIEWPQTPLGVAWICEENRRSKFVDFKAKPSAPLRPPPVIVQSDTWIWWAVIIGIAICALLLLLT